MGLLRDRVVGSALDASATTLYVADEVNNRVRAIDLASGIIRTVAGGGNATAPAYGDGGPATSAALSSPNMVSISPAGALYIGDPGHSRIRKLDFSTGIISAFMDPTTCAATDVIQFSSCVNGNCAMAWDAGGVTVAAQVCGTGPPGRSGCRRAHAYTSSIRTPASSRQGPGTGRPGSAATTDRVISDGSNASLRIMW